MIVDGRTLPSGTEIETDVCIVGAGPSGVALAGELLGSGIRACVLENGGTRETWRTQFLLGGESVGYPYPRLVISAVSAFGGSSHRWGPYWHARPLDAIDFEAREAIPHSGWPFARGHLVPYYERAERYFGLSPFDFRGDDTRDRRVPQTPRSAEAAGDGRASARRHRLCPGVRSPGRGPGRTGRSQRTRRRADRRRSSLGPHRRCARADRAGEVCVGQGATSPCSPPAESATPGCSSSATPIIPGGIGNQHDLVGRYFMEHPALRSGVVVPTDPALLRRRDLFAAFGQAGVSGVPIFALSEEVLREQGLQNTYFILEPKPRAYAAAGVRAALTLHAAIRMQPLTRKFPGRVARAVAAAPTVARAFRARGAEPDLFLVTIQAEQAPNPESRVTLSEKRNRLGIRNARLDWRLLASDTVSIRRAQEFLATELEAAGLGRMHDLLGDERPPALIGGIYHHLGTTRMHADPQHGVVDPSCRVHGVSDLYVTGGSVFPTSGAANPTLTIVALALRLADEVKRVLAAR